MNGLDRPIGLAVIVVAGEQKLGVLEIEAHSSALVDLRLRRLPDCSEVEKNEQVEDALGQNVEVLEFDDDFSARCFLVEVLAVLDCRREESAALDHDHHYEECVDLCPQKLHLPNEHTK